MRRYTEAVALLRGEQRCVVDDEETNPVLVMSGAMREFVYTPVPGTQLVIQNMRLDMFGYVDAGLGMINASPANDTDRTAWSFADLAFRLEMTGSIKLFGTNGLPDLGGIALDMAVLASIVGRCSLTVSKPRDYFESAPGVCNQSTHFKLQRDGQARLVSAVRVLA